jgi:hypothetical protein
MGRDRSLTIFLRELRLPSDERAAARAERRVEAEMRRQRDNQETPERRAAAIEAESRRYRGFTPHR